ncbi:MAG: hypothetical protein V2J62_09925 [candidate division KSB1 bacterium]|nr:hypothetical protein [candidate division KSB1 bacterium]
MITVLLVVTVFTILIGAFSTAFILRLRFIRNSINQMQAQYSAEAGIYKTLWLLSQKGGSHGQSDQKNQFISLFEDQSGTVTIGRWGGYYDIQSSALFKNRQHSAHVIAGERVPPELDYAIVLGSDMHPLVITDRTVINGNIAVGMKGVKNRSGFNHSRAVPGNIERRKELRLPYFNPVQFQNAIQYFELLIKTTNGSQIHGDLAIDASMQFSDEAIHVSGNIIVECTDEKAMIDLREGIMLIAGGDVHISSAARLGHRLQIACAGQLKIGANVSFDDNILYAGRGIHLSASCTGNVQLISNGLIIVDGNSTLSYPSTVYSARNVLSRKSPGGIHIRTGSTVHGAVIHWYKASTSRTLSDNKISVVIEAGARVSGLVYNIGDTMMEGEVSSLIATRQFKNVAGSTVYLNRLDDVIINRSIMDNRAILPLSFHPDARYGILNWVYE